MSPSYEPSVGSESPRDRVERLIAEGRLTRDAVHEAERVWAERLQHGVRMANREIVTPERTLKSVYVVNERRVRRLARRGERLWPPPS